ncbi:hypothetical protein HS088_TW07G00388 [Tripterygium wilfordii]|uniref:DDT domain-containing protein PTM-like n=1 Tax=Tripterygium wilfordii TaxID=458696 RepID=A0A7J7DEV2_TRIWF|nr:DDT domain-containing protein PTM-like [Tripterygium wilfordii]KAF5744808.1 hypothetical protein HS088_TW07G00388 [Tripterygium wilfordii]
MEPTQQKRPRGRPRKRKAEDGATDAKSSIKTKRRVVEMRCVPLVDRYVLKEFKGNGIYLGKITHYDTGYYRVDYEDGDSEELDSGELREIILTENDFDGDLSARKKKLDELVVENSVKRKNDLEKKAVEWKKDLDQFEASALSVASGGSMIENDDEQVETDADSSSVSAEDVAFRDSSYETRDPRIPPPLLPPSSGTIPVPEDYVSYLFSVYSFLRSFSICLFLSPFGLADFVGALNFHVRNTLLDAIHLALMRALKCHLETLSLDGSDSVATCLRSADWSLLDAFTWPVYLIQYLTVMRYTKGPEWKGFHDDALKREYYSLPVGRKLVILQILCDDVSESAEFRAEIDMREETEVGIDVDAVATKFRENGPRRVHPRYAKTSACKDKGSEMKTLCYTKSLVSQDSETDVVAADVDVDKNSDECRLCGMDGMLLCCDGCPSAYHFRCINVGKSSIREGRWYCPECKINQTEPPITVGTSLRGAEDFGIDLYERVFLGTCDYLLVLGDSVNGEPFCRYYNRNDIPRVVQALLSSVQHESSYSGICKAILQYWSIPENAFPLLRKVETITDSNVDDGEAVVPFQSQVITNHKVPGKAEAENSVSLDESDRDHVALSCLEISVGKVNQTELGGPVSNGETIRFLDFAPQNVKVPDRIMTESAKLTNSVSPAADPSGKLYQSLVGRSSAVDLAICNPASSSASFLVHANSMYVPVQISSHGKEGDNSCVGRNARNSSEGCSFRELPFKPHSYTNQYMLGDFAASAAANLAIISSEEARSLEALKLGNARKIASANISLQVKAFSLSASRFFCPIPDKKLMEFPRERCGWCEACKLPQNSRRACLLNSAASTATKGAMKFLNGPFPINNQDGSLSSIAAYILYMEESLYGLIVGPFLSASYRQQWRKQVGEASTCSALKMLLVQLEENIRVISFSGDWVKHVDDCLVESSVDQSAAGTVGTVQKRGPGGKRYRRQSGISEAVVGDCHDKVFIWWEGGKLLKSLFQKALLPSSMVKKGARQGGLRKISGIQYTNGSDIPKRSRRLVWRAAVEKTFNTSQLAFQVRYLDLHVRWSDLVRLEQNPQDVKGPEMEASAFRNATICDKRIVENKTTYGVFFGNQKHLPSRVMKNIIEIEQRGDGNKKYWFPEICIPLYLIREYEESVEKVILPLAKNPVSELSEVQRRQLNDSRRDIFYYLALKRDKLGKCTCNSCQLDVLLRNAVKCSACQGYCHEQCTQSSTVYMNEEVEFSITCYRCYHPLLTAQKDNSSGSPTSPLSLQRREHHNVEAVNKSAKPKSCNQPLASAITQERDSETMQANSVSSLSAKSKKCSWGVIWKKKNNEDAGIEFRHKNILLRGSSDLQTLKPVCNLCKKQYNADAMYIHCETCTNWFHAKAVELEESKLSDVMGFKCCKCRRIKSPKCPYDDASDVEKAEGSKPCSRVPKEENIAGNSDPAIASAFKVGKPTTRFPAAEDWKKEYDPLFFSLSRVEQMTEHNSGMGPQKLPVRRHVKHEKEIDGFSENNSTHAEASIVPDSNHLMDANEEFSFVKWDVSSNNLEGAVVHVKDEVKCEDMEFEPQTYFTFEELLAPDDAGHLDEFDASGNLLENGEYQSWGVSQDGVYEQYEMEASNGFLQPTTTTMCCHSCAQIEPAPDLCCEICGLAIHSQCNHWAELSPLNGGWRCGNCREWQ